MATLEVETLPDETSLQTVTLEDGRRIRVNPKYVSADGEYLCVACTKSTGDRLGTLIDADADKNSIGLCGSCFVKLYSFPEREIPLDDVVYT